MTNETSAGGIVFKKQGDLYLWLIIQHSYRKDHWGFPKGHVGDVKKDETVEEAAVREVREEGGIVARIITPVVPPSQYYFTFNSKKIYKTVHYFLMEYVNGSTNDHDDEISNAQFVTFEKALSLLTHKEDKKQLEMAIELSKQCVE